MSLLDLATLNGSICILAFVIDSSIFVKRYEMQSVCYERIENIKPQNRDKLIADLKLRTGLNVMAVEIEHIDFLRDTAQLKVSYIPDSIKQTQAITQSEQSLTEVI
jgi:hypothetical protein